jgi:CelD/BcsL family acetyltransferase involved in cellulose biosynthesis
MQRPIEYRDRQDRVWSVSEVAVLKVVAPAIDGPNLCLVIRFEREGEERFARWLGDTDWREHAALHRLFEGVDTPRDDTGVGPAPPRPLHSG